MTRRSSCRNLGIQPKLSSSFTRRFWICTASEVGHGSTSFDSVLHGTRDETRNQTAHCWAVKTSQRCAFRPQSSVRPSKTVIGGWRPALQVASDPKGKLRLLTCERQEPHRPAAADSCPLAQRSARPVHSPASRDSVLPAEAVASTS